MTATIFNPEAKSRYYFLSEASQTETQLTVDPNKQAPANKTGLRNSNPGPNRNPSLSPSNPPGRSPILASPPSPYSPAVAKKILEKKNKTLRPDTLSLSNIHARIPGNNVTNPIILQKTHGQIKTQNGLAYGSEQ
jgi:hypothetical protein